MSHLPLDARAILEYLNELGYRNISAEQLKEFLKDLRKLIKHDSDFGFRSLEELDCLEKLYRRPTVSSRAKAGEDKKCTKRYMKENELFVVNSRDSVRIDRRKCQDDDCKLWWQGIRPFSSAPRSKDFRDSSRSRSCSVSKASKMKPIAKKCIGNCSLKENDLIVVESNDSIIFERAPVRKNCDNPWWKNLHPFASDPLNNCRNPSGRVSRTSLPGTNKEFCKRFNACPNKTQKIALIHSDGKLSEKTVSVPATVNCTPSITKLPQCGKTCNRPTKGKLTNANKTTTTNCKMTKDKYPTTCKCTPPIQSNSRAQRCCHNPPGALVPLKAISNRPVKLTDRVALYHYYRCEWDHHQTKIPGETPRSQLRWRTRCRIFEPDE